MEVFTQFNYLLLLGLDLQLQSLFSKVWMEDFVTLVFIDYVKYRISFGSLGKLDIDLRLGLLYFSHPLYVFIQIVLLLEKLMILLVDLLVDFHFVTNLELVFVFLKSLFE